MTAQEPRVSRRESPAGASSAAVFAEQPPAPLKLCVFSKQFHWTTCGEMAQMATEVGFDGIDLTLREGGHVLPERVEQDLSAAVEALRTADLQVPMITTMISDPSSSHADSILRTAGWLGIRRYRWGYLRYLPDRAIAEQLAVMKVKAKALAELNRECGICALYHIHSGIGRVGVKG